MKQRVDAGLLDLRNVTEGVQKGVLADLEVGIAGGVNVKKQKSGVSIDNRGGGGQFILDSPNASQFVGRDQSTSTGIDTTALMQLLRQVREVLAKVEVTPDSRAEIEDALVNAEREITSPMPDPSRAIRLLRALGTRLEQFGIGVAASLVGSYLRP
jgi:hypothetical protein